MSQTQGRVWFLLGSVRSLGTETSKWKLILFTPADGNSYIVSETTYSGGWGEILQEMKIFKTKIQVDSLNEVIPLYIYIFTLLLYITVNTTTIEYNANATCFDLQKSFSG